MGLTRMCKADKERMSGLVIWLPVAPQFDGDADSSHGGAAEVLAPALHDAEVWEEFSSSVEACVEQSFSDSFRWLSSHDRDRPAAWSCMESSSAKSAARSCSGLSLSSASVY